MMVVAFTTTTLVADAERSARSPRDEARAGDGDRRAATEASSTRRDGGDAGDRVVGVVVRVGRCGCPAGGGHGDVHGSRARRSADVRWVPLTTVAAIGEPPNDTVAPLTKPVPTIVTVFPPASGPAAGDTAVTVGTGS